jgi:hypothetical protein
VPAYGGENGENVTDNNLQKPPKSLEGRASFISVDGGGYWVMYQDAATGKAV